MDKILERVRKMLALANDMAATEGERDNALRMALATLTKHELDMEDVSQFERDKIDPRGEYTMEGWNLVWCRDIRSAVGKLFMCSYYYRKINATRGAHYFVGRESNATTAMYMADWIIKGLLKEADKRYGHRLTPGGRSFGVGAASKLWDRVYQMQRAAQQEVTGSGSELILADLAKSEDAANQTWMDEFAGEIKNIKPRETTVDINAYRDGSKHADGISLNTQVSNKKGTLAIK